MCSSRAIFCVKIVAFRSNIVLFAIWTASVLFFASMIAVIGPKSSSL